MKIPIGRSGYPTLSATQFRTYGTGGFRLEEQEAEQGCPRLYHAKYVEGIVETDEKAYPLRYGGLFHRVLQLLEDGRTPDEALAEAFEPDMPQEMWTEARADLTRYLERGAMPLDLYGTLGTELDLQALLYTDEEYGPVYYRGILDWLGVDLSLPDVLHLVDYKTNRQPPSQNDLAGDVQMRGYDWLVRMNAEKWTTSPVRIVTHYDAVKFREVSISYDDGAIEDWESWAIAVVRKILRDEEHLPVLNPGCAYCPVQMSCPAFAAMPDHGTKMLAQAKGLQTPEQIVKWRDEANRVRLALQNAVTAVDVKIKNIVVREGELIAAGSRFSLEPSFENLVDLRKLHSVMGDAFYGTVSTSKAAIDRATTGWNTDALGQVLACIDRVPTGRKMTRKTVA